MKNGTIKNSYIPETNTNHFKLKEKSSKNEEEINHYLLNNHKLTSTKSYERFNIEKKSVKNNLEKINKVKNNINNNNDNKMLKKSNSKNNVFIPKKTFTKQLSKFNNKISQIPYEKLEKEIDNILNDTNEKISSLTISLSQIDINAENSYLKIQEEYSKALENLYKERINNIKEINEQFDFEIYEKKKNLIDDNNIFLEVNNKKEEKLKCLFEDFIKKKEEINNKFEKQVQEIKKNCILLRKRLFNNTIYDEIKEKILNLLNNTNNNSNINNIDNPTLKKSATAKNIFNKPINKLLSMNRKLKPKI